MPDRHGRLVLRRPAVDRRRPLGRVRAAVLTDPALSFGTAAEAYERGRPSWPPALLDELPLDADAVVLDLGAGTGKLTRVLAGRYARVLAVEPDDAMRALIPAGGPLAGRAEAIPLADGSVDAVFAAEAFHWFDGERALAEIARVLVPGGVLALLSNRFAPEDRLLPDGVLPPDPDPGRNFSSGRWRGAFAGAPFGPLRETSLQRTLIASREEVLAYFASVSPITSLASEERARALERVAAALDRPSYERRLTTILVWTTRTPVSSREA